MFCGNKKAQVQRSYISVDTVTETSSFLSTYVYKLTEDDKKNISNFLSLDLSTTYQQWVESEVSHTISTEISVDVPETSGFVPKINQLYVGFYPVPLLSQYIPHMDWVDSLPSTVIKYGFDETTSAAYYPYVDRFVWGFDELSLTDY